MVSWGKDFEQKFIIFHFMRITKKVTKINSKLIVKHSDIVILIKFCKYFILYCLKLSVKQKVKYIYIIKLSHFVKKITHLCDTEV